VPDVPLLYFISTKNAMLTAVCLKKLGLICTLTYCSSSITECSVLFYYILVSPNYEYTSSVCSNIMTANANLPGTHPTEGCSSMLQFFLNYIPYNYIYVLYLLKLQTL